MMSFPPSPLADLCLPVLYTNTLGHIPFCLPISCFSSVFHTEYVWKQLPQPVNCGSTSAPGSLFQTGFSDLQKDSETNRLDLRLCITPRFNLPLKTFTLHFFPPTMYFSIIRATLTFNVHSVFYLVNHPRGPMSCIFQATDPSNTASHVSAEHLPSHM